MTGQTRGDRSLRRYHTRQPRLLLTAIHYTSAQNTGACFVFSAAIRNSRCCLHVTTSNFDRRAWERAYPHHILSPPCIASLKRTAFLQALRFLQPFDSLYALLRYETSIFRKRRYIIKMHEISRWYLGLMKWSKCWTPNYDGIRRHLRKQENRLPPWLAGF